MPKISVPQKKLVLESPLGENLMRFVQSKGIPVASSCIGDGVCGKCRLMIKGQISKPSDLEVTTLSRNQAPAGARLACQIHIEIDLSVESTYW